jgi:hypothetical protein
MIDENRKKRGRPGGGPGSIASNNKALASDVVLLEDRLTKRGKKLPTRIKIIAHVIAKSINQYLKNDKPIYRKVRGQGKVGREKSKQILLAIQPPKDKIRVNAQWVIDNPLPGLPDGWFETTYTAVERILGAQKK